MSVHLITYDLNQPEQNYGGLYEAIRSLGEVVRCLESVWLVETTLSSRVIKGQIEGCVDENDSLLVTEITRDTAAHVPEKCAEWIENRLLVL